MPVSKSEIRPTVCGFCLADCGLLAEVEAGGLIGVRGDPDNPHNLGRICVKGKLSPKVVNHPERLLSPLKRSDSGGFVRISWEEALDEIAERLVRLAADHGPEALAVYTGRAGRFLDRAVVKAFTRLFRTPNLTATWSLCVGPKILGYKAVMGPPLFPSGDFRNSRLIVLWGANPAETRLNRWHRINADIKAAREAGAKVWVIDPRPTRSARRADRHLPINPGTDSFLAMALVKILIEKGWYDREFVERHADGLAELEEAASGAGPKRASEATGLSLKDILELAEDLGSIRPAVIDRREGVIHLRNATSMNVALAALNALVGAVDRPGGLTFNHVTRWRDHLGVSTGDMPPPVWAGRHPLANDGSQALNRAVLEGEPYPVKGLMVMGGNPAAAWPGTGRTMAALEALDLLVVDDLFMTETARAAHFVLPGAVFYEKGEFIADPLRLGDWAQAVAPVVRPRGAARPEWRAVADLAARLGYDGLSGYRDEDDLIRRIFSDTGRDDLDPVALRRGVELAPRPVGRLRETGFNTPTKRLDLTGAWLLGRGGGFEGLTARDVCPVSDRFPLRLITGHRVDCFSHSQHRNIPELLKLHPGPEIQVSPELAMRLGLESGDTVVVSTADGSLEAPLGLVPGMNPETVAFLHGWPGKANANYLTSEEDVDPVAGTPAYRAIPCRLDPVS